MAAAPLFKGLLQSLCRSHCARTTIALACALVPASPFLLLPCSQPLSVPLCLNASLPRSTSAQEGTREHALFPILCHQTHPPHTPVLEPSPLAFLSTLGKKIMKGEKAEKKHTKKSRYALIGFKGDQSLNGKPFELIPQSAYRQM